MSFFITAGKEILPPTINRSNYNATSSCFSKQGSDPSCPTWFNFGQGDGQRSRVKLNRFGIFSQGTSDTNANSYFSIFYGPSTLGGNQGYIDMRNSKFERNLLDSSLFLVQNDKKLSLLFDGENLFFRLFRYINSDYQQLLYNNGSLLVDATSNGYRGSVKMNPYDASFYSYVFDGASSNYSIVDGSWPQISTGYGMSYFGESLGFNSAFCAIGNTGSRYFGFKLASYYNYHEFGVNPNSDEILWSIGNNYGQYYAVYLNNSETSFWAYDRFGTNLLWNSRGSGKLHMWGDSRYNLLMFSISPSNGESAIWSADEDGTNLLWNSNKKGRLELWDYIGSYIAFYIKDQTGFWFTKKWYTDLKFDGRAGIFQVWNNDRRSYIDLSVYMLEPMQVATFNYVRCNGQLVKDATGRYIKVLSTYDLEICDPLKYNGSSTGRKDPECVLQYEG
ncbi:hypothetical protein EBU95_07570 [bacterium]|nr:hypothetical protein [bacterium]